MAKENLTNTTTCTKPEPGKSAFSHGGKDGATIRSTCRNCRKPIEKHVGTDAKTKADTQWHHHAED